MKIQELIKQASQKQYSYFGYVDIHMYLSKLETLKEVLVKPLLKQLYSQGEKKGVKYGFKLSYKGTDVSMSFSLATMNSIAHHVVDIASRVEDLDELDVIFCDVDWVRGLGFPGKEKMIKLKF
jgi:hypothetical protein